MKEIVITKKSGITLNTKKTLVDDDIKIKLDKSILKEESKGKIEITTTDEVDVSGYETAQVVDENLIAENIAKDVNILGVVGTYEGGSSGNTLKNLLNNTKSCYYLFYDVRTIDDISNLIQYNDTENVKNFSNMFYKSQYVTTFPQELNTKKGETFDYMFYNCSWGETFTKMDVRNAISLGNYMYKSCISATSILMYGMKTAFSISDCTKLEAPALVTILSNCQVITSTKTLTMGSTLLAKLNNVYVKETGVEQYEGITCRPCVICESTDAGAMLATDYFTGKGWTLA